MKKLIAAAAMVLSTAAVAQQGADRWDCQVVHSSGMDWQGYQWVTKTYYKGRRFELVADKWGLLTKASVIEAFNVTGFAYDDAYTCRTDGRNLATCNSKFTGDGLFFDTEAGKGGISALFGSIATDNSRDSVAVSAFECIKG